MAVTFSFAYVRFAVVAIVLAASAARSTGPSVAGEPGLGVLALEAPSLDHSEHQAHREWGSALASFC
jgi:hypothetical protein